MWELQPLSNNRRTTKNLSITRRKHLTYSSHKYLTILWDYFPSLILLLFLSYSAHKARMHCLFIGKLPCLCLAKDKSTNWCCKWYWIGAHFVDLGVARVRRRGDRPPSRNNRNIYSWKIRRDKEFLSLYVKIWTGSRHLVFWLLGTLTGL